MGHGGGGDKKNKNVSKTPYIIGSATAGILEIIIFHPIDTIAKRLMNNKTAVNWGNVSSVIFKDAQNKGFASKWLSLFPGVSFGAAYKILQRTYKFGSQPILKDYFEKRFGESYIRMFGSKKSGLDMLQATSGALVGIGEVVLLPLDVLKIKAQTNPDALKGRGLIDIIVKENIKLYRGTLWTAARNAPGSFALFGANSLVYTRLFNVDGPRNAKGYQIFVGSMAGGLASILVSSPLDVVKTRIQAAKFNENKGGFTIVKDLLRDEGPFAFFKGITPKIGLIGPKLVFSFTVAQWLVKELEILWETRGWNPPPTTSALSSSLPNKPKH